MGRSWLDWFKPKKKAAATKRTSLINDQARDALRRTSVHRPIYQPLPAPPGLRKEDQVAIHRPRTAAEATVNRSFLDTDDDDLVPNRPSDLKRQDTVSGFHQFYAEAGITKQPSQPAPPTVRPRTATQVDPPAKPVRSVRAAAFKRPKTAPVKRELISSPLPLSDRTPSPKHMSMALMDKDDPFRPISLIPSRRAPLPPGLAAESPSSATIAKAAERPSLANSVKGGRPRTADRQSMISVKRIPPPSQKSDEKSPPDASASQVNTPLPTPPLPAFIYTTPLKPKSDTPITYTSAADVAATDGYFSIPTTPSLPPTPALSLSISTAPSSSTTSPVTTFTSTNPSPVSPSRSFPSPSQLTAVESEGAKSLDALFEALGIDVGQASLEELAVTKPVEPAKTEFKSSKRRPATPGCLVPGRQGTFASRQAVRPRTAQ